jgi:cell pole-organizing protein PopZ
MTQPAKVQEPSMEEILASIRRIIADDEAKPPVADTKPVAVEKPAAPPPPAKAEKPAAPAPSPKPAISDIPPSKVAPSPPPKAAAAPPPAAAVPAPPPPAPAPPPAASASNNQDDIDALLNGLDEATTEEEIRPAQPEAEAEAEVFELTDDMAVASVPPPPLKPAFQKVEPEDDLEFTESAASRAINRPPTYEPPAFDPPPAASTPQAAILSHSTVSAVESAFNTLAHTVLSNNARTLEDLVKEMLRPMLKSWLDDNLPGLVERIVKAEIERVSRGR